jgi:hypothetical protein
MDRSAEDLRGASYALFEAAREAGQYEVAYHALAALLHAAEALADVDTCGLVERSANACREVVDAHGMRHRLSTESAAARGHESIFRQLALTAASARLRMEADAVHQKAKGRPKAPFAHGKS